MNRKKYEEKIISQMTCASFLKLKFNNKFLFIEDINILENEWLNFISQCTIIYKGKKISFEEYNEDLKLTNEKFQADLIDNYYIKNCDEVFKKHKKYYRVLKLFDSISNNISYAKYYADLSYQKLPDSIFDSIKTYAKIYFIRGMHFFTSIMWYGTCRDYLLQIFCAKFDLYSELTDKNTEEMEFKELAKLCNLTKIRQLNDKHRKDKDFYLWFKKIDECAKCLDDKLINLNNNLKHRGGCNLKNFNGNYCINDNNETNLEYFNIPDVDIDEEYDLLIKSHNSIVECYNYFLNSINSELDLLFKRNT